MGQDARLQTPTPEASPAAVPDGCLAPCTSLGLSPELLGPTWSWRVMSNVTCSIAASWLRLGMLGLPLTHAFTVGVGGSRCYIPPGNP